MQLFIKNMVCDRCIMVVRQQLEDSNIPYSNIQLGEVELAIQPSETQLSELRQKLLAAGFELLDDKRSALIVKIKSFIVQMVHGNGPAEMSGKLSIMLSEKLHLDYHYLSALFSSIEGITIEKYVILQRVERAKEFLKYDELNLNEISYILGYSSVQHLSHQFKKVTGLTPSHFKQMKNNTRIALDKIG